MVNIKYSMRDLQFMMSNTVREPGSCDMGRIWEEIRLSKLQLSLLHHLLD